MSFNIASYTALSVIYLVLYCLSMAAATLPLRSTFRTIRAGGLVFSGLFAYLNTRLDLLSGASAWTAGVLHTGGWTPIVLFLFYLYTYWCIYSVFRPRYYSVLFGVPLYEFKN